MIEYFNTGLLPLPNGTTLRAYLAEKLKWYVRQTECCFLVCIARDYHRPGTLFPNALNVLPRILHVELLPRESVVRVHGVQA